MKTVYGEQRGASGGTEHNKGYKIVDDGRKVVASWGPVGNLRDSKVLCESSDADERKKAFDKQFKAKFQRKTNPYTVIQQDGQQVENRPSSEGRQFGLEVETHTRVSIDDVISGMESRGLQVNDQRSRYFHSTGQKWDVKRDGSCGYEFASPKLSGDSGIFDAKVAVEKIREVCPTAVNDKCGIHVTVSIEDYSFEDFKRLVIGYLRAQDHFYAQVASERRHNHYCAPNPTSGLPALLKARTVGDVMSLVDGSNRYHGLNLTNAVSGRGFSRVEFRMMEGSVAIRKVAAWIRTTVGFVSGIKKSGVTFKSVDPISEETFNKIVEGTWSV